MVLRESLIGGGEGAKGSETFKTRSRVGKADKWNDNPKEMEGMDQNTNQGDLSRENRLEVRWQAQH